MARRQFFQNPATGRFVSESVANTLENAIRSVYDGGLVEQQVLVFGRPQEVVVGDLGGNWTEQSTQRGMSWHADDEPLDPYWLRQEPFPDGFDEFKIIVFVPDNPDYPRKYASSDPLTSGQWPPDMDVLEHLNPTGIARIIFRRS